MYNDRKKENLRTWLNGFESNMDCQLKEEIMTKKIIIFGKSGWPYTEKARSAYGKNAKYFDVEADNAKLEEMLKYSKGNRKVPVVVEGDEITIGYGGTWGVWVPSRLLVSLNFKF